MPSMPRLLRHDTGARKPGSKTRTTAWRAERSFQWCRQRRPSGLRSWSPSQALERAPTHDSVTRVPGKPVDSTSSAMVFVLWCRDMRQTCRAPTPGSVVARCIRNDRRDHVRRHRPDGFGRKAAKRRRAPAVPWPRLARRPRIRCAGSCPRRADAIGPHAEGLLDRRVVPGSFRVREIILRAALQLPRIGGPIPHPPRMTSSSPWYCAGIGDDPIMDAGRLAADRLSSGRCTCAATAPGK
jgi:hypothetical protein